MFKVTLCFAPIFFKRKAEYEVLCCVSDDSGGGEFIPLKNDEDSSLKRKVMAVIQELSVSNGSVYDTFFIGVS